jgi:hypothetical protein
LEKGRVERNFQTAQDRLVKGTRKIEANYTFSCDGARYQIERQAVATGLRGAQVRVDQRLDGTFAVRHGEKYLPIRKCEEAKKPKAAEADKKTKTLRGGAKGRGSDWNKNFDLKKAPELWKAVQSSGYRREQPAE